MPIEVWTYKNDLCRLENQEHGGGTWEHKTGLLLALPGEAGKGRQTLFYIQNRVRDKDNRKPRRTEQRGGRILREVANLWCWKLLYSMCGFSQCAFHSIWKEHQVFQAIWAPEIGKSWQTQMLRKWEALVSFTSWGLVSPISGCQHLLLTFLLVQIYFSFGFILIFLPSSTHVLSQLPSDNLAIHFLRYLFPMCSN